MFTTSRTLGALLMCCMVSPATAIIKQSSLDFNISSILVDRGTSQAKRGLPFNNPPTFIQHFDGKGSQVNWAYNWGSDMPAEFPSSYLEFVPMLWGNKADRTAQWHKNAKNALARGSRHILGFNEPDRCGWGQACMTPSQAVKAWRRYIQPYRRRAKLGSPAITSQDGVGLPWLKNFMKRCRGCKIDFIAVHWYGDVSHEEHLKWFLGEVKKFGGGRKVWITEFAAFGTPQQQIDFLDRIMPWLDGQGYIERYAWFWTDPAYTQGSLTKQDGWPTDLGNVYAYTPSDRMR